MKSCLDFLYKMFSKLSLEKHFSIIPINHSVFSNAHKYHIYSSSRTKNINLPKTTAQENTNYRKLSACHV